MTAQEVTACAWGIPVPQGAIRPRSRAGGGAYGHHSNAATLTPWRVTVACALRDAHPGAPLTGPVAVTVTFTMPRPASAPKRRRTWPDRRPDLDKLIRAVLDAATDAGVWRDDAQVVQIAAAECYPGDPDHPGALPTPGAHIHIREIGDRP